MKTQLLFVILLILGISSISAQTDSNAIAIENLTIAIEKLDSQICESSKQREILKSQKDVLEMEETNKNLKVNEATVSFLNESQFCVNHNSKMITVVVNKIRFHYDWSKEDNRWEWQDGKREQLIVAENYTSGTVLTFQVENDFYGDIEVLIYNADGTAIPIINSYKP